MILLPPGNAPAPEVGDDPGLFPDFWQDDLYPWLSARVVLPYPNATARAADLAGLGPSSKAVTFLEDSRTLWRWTGTTWGLAAPWVQSGTATFTTNATSDSATRTATVTFPVAFTSTPTVRTESLTGATSPSTTWATWASALSTTGFQLNGLRNNTTAMTVRWWAELTP